jgi:DNA repair ATPase RecN
MIPALKEHIEQYKNLHDTKDHLQVLDIQRLEQQQLLDKLMPWIHQKAEMLREKENLLQKVFGKRESELEKIRDEHHRLTLRAREIQEKIDLLDYEKKVLKEKLVQIPSLKYKIDKLVEETELETVDQHTREMLKAIKQTNTYIRENNENKRKTVEAIDTGRSIVQMIRNMTQNIKRSLEGNPIDPLQAILNNDFFPTQTYKRKAMELIPEIARAIRKWDEQIANINYHPKPDEKLSEIIHESYFRRIIVENFTGYMSYDVITDLNYTLDKFQKQLQKLQKTLQSLDEEKQSFDQHKHELMLGNF